MPIVFSHEIRRSGVVDTPSSVPPQGTRFQQFNNEIVRVLKGFAPTCAKLAYMLYYEFPIREFEIDYRGLTNAEEKLESTYNKLFENREDWVAEINRITEPVKYMAITQRSIYGMWGKWYIGGNGWHRGIDLNFSPTAQDLWNPTVDERKCDLYAVMSGYIVRKTMPDSVGGLSLLNIYNPRHNITVTYMHLNVASSLAVRRNEDGIQLPFEEQQYIRLGTLIGTQDRYGTPAIHTHIEFTQGEYRGSCPRPWSNDRGRQISRYENLEGIRNNGNEQHNDIFSLNPFPIIGGLWSDYISATRE